MPRPARPLSFLLSLVFVSAISASTQRVEVTGGGRLEHLSHASRVPSEIREGMTLTVSFLLDVDQKAEERDDQTATYRPVSATFNLGNRILPLREAAFVVQRYDGSPIGPGYGYLMRGVTTAGWLFSIGIGSTDPAYAPDFSVPTVLPVAPLDYAHDVTLRDPDKGWGAYGDATLWKIEERNVSAPSRLIGALARLDRAGLRIRQAW